MTKKSSSKKENKGRLHCNASMLLVLLFVALLVVQWAYF